MQQNFTEKHMHKTIIFSLHKNFPVQRSNCIPVPTVGIYWLHHKSIKYHSSDN